MRKGDNRLGRMLKARSAGKKLRTKHVRMFDNGNDASFLVDMVRRGHSMAARDKPQSGILHRLQFPPDDAWPGHGPPDAGGVVVRRADEHLEGVE